MRYPTRPFLALAVFASLLAACGQTGALYLPDEGITTPVEVRPGPTAPAEGVVPPVEGQPAPTATPAEDEEPEKSSPTPLPPGTGN